MSPTTSRGLAAEYTAAGKTFVAAPVFARPDGLLKRQATWMVAGEEKGRVVAGKLLESSGAVSITFDAKTKSLNRVKKFEFKISEIKKLKEKLKNFK